MVAPRRERFTQEVPIARQRLAGASILAILAALGLAVSPVAGFHWTPTTILAGPDESVSASRSAIAADGSRLYVTYVESGAAWLRSSTDGGASFGAPVNVSDAGATDVGSTSVAAANGIGYVSWVDTSGGAGPRAWLRRTEDGGATWGRAVAMTPVGASPVAARVFAVRERVYLTWEDAASDRLVLRRSRDMGASFTPPTTIGTSTSGTAATMAFGEQVVYLAWESSWGNVRLRRSTTGGITWNAAATLRLGGQGGPLSASPWIAAHGRRAVLAMASRGSDAGGTVSVRVTTDRGSTWGAARRVTSTAVSEGGPVVVHGKAGWWMATSHCSDPDSCEGLTLRVRTSADGLTWSGPTLGASGGLLWTAGGAYASTAGQVWYAWVQEPSWEDYGTYEVVARASY